MKPEKVSIIIPFVQWSEYLTECIRYCLTQDYHNFDIVLLPDCPAELPGEFRDVRVRVIVTGDVTIAEKRNIGIRASLASDYVAFIDSDAYPATSWLRCGIKAFSRDAELWAVGGPNITPPSEPALQRAVGNASRSFLISGPRAFRKRIAPNRFCKDLPTCNLIVAKRTLVTLTGFDKNLVTGEDIEFCSRVIKAGKKIYYDNEVVVFHHNRSLFMPFILQRITYGFSVFRLLKKDPSPYNLVLFIPLIMLLVLALGPILALFFNVLVLPILIFYVLLFGIIVVETVRNASGITEIPLTFCALLLGSITPGIGSLLAGLGKKVDIKKTYRNC